MNKPGNEADTRAFGDEFKIYGDRFALDLFSGRNKASSHHVVNLKIARKITGTNTFDWTHDWIWVQVSDVEVAPVLSVLLGYQPSVSLEHFNNGVMKHLELRVNPPTRSSGSSQASQRSYYLSMKTQEMGSARGVKIEDRDRVRMSIFFFRVFMKNNGGVAQEVLYSMLRDIYGRAELGQAAALEADRAPANR